MADTRCPHCGGPGMSVARKLLRPTAPTACPSCGQRVSLPGRVAWLPMLPVLAAMAFADHAFPTNRAARLLTVIAVGVLANVLYLLRVPLVRR